MTTNWTVDMAFTTASSNTFSSAAHGRGWIGELFAAVQRWHDYRETVNALRQLSAYELADIGLVPAQIDAAAREAVYGAYHR